MIARLPASLRHKNSDNLIRLGRPYDGGYVVSKDDVLASDFMMSFGVSDDWSFEEQFLQLNPVPLEAYDRSISGLIFLRHYLKNPHKLSKLKTFFSYLTFFNYERRHIRKFVGEATGKKHLSLKSILDGVTAQKIFIKMDIEGSEYRLLDTLIAYQDRISGIAVELHDCDLHLERIERFVDALQLKIVHIHANDYGTVSTQGIPHLLEITFSRHAPMLDDWRNYPQSIDVPNRRGGKSIELTFD